MLWGDATYGSCTIENLVMFDASSGAIINSALLGLLIPDPDKLTDICWSPDNSKLLIVGKNNFVATILDAQTLEPILSLNSSGQNTSYCDWSINDVIAIRDSEGLKIFTPFDIESPNIDISIGGGGVVYDTMPTTNISIIIDDYYSLDLDSIEVNLNDSEWLSIFDTSYHTVCDSATWNFNLKPTNIQEGINSIEIGRASCRERV